ncbi:MAG TPA: hypothetical protein VJ123_05340 [Anaerolineales bacterium]|nr:hypothetical protein [Anaerolineales bacterium]
MPTSSGKVSLRILSTKIFPLRIRYPFLGTLFLVSGYGAVTNDGLRLMSPSHMPYVQIAGLVVGFLGVIALLGSISGVIHDDPWESQIASERNRQLFAIAVALVGILVVLTVLFAVYYPLIWRLVLPIDQSVPQELIELANTAELIVAFLAFSVTVAGLGVYKVVGDRLSNQVVSQTSKESYQTYSISLMHQSFSFWAIYTNGYCDYPRGGLGLEARHIFLDQAIGKLREALDRYASHFSLEDAKNREILFKLKVSFVQYVSEAVRRWKVPGLTPAEGWDYQKVLENDRQRACRYVREMDENLPRAFDQKPEEVAEWERTIEKAKPLLSIT